MSRPELDEIVVGDPPAAWEALGFTLVEGAVPIGGVRIRPTGEGGVSTISRAAGKNAVSAALFADGKRITFAADFEDSANVM